MTIAHKAITAIVFSLATIIAAFVLSLTTSYNVNAAELNTGKASYATVSPDVTAANVDYSTPMLSDEHYKATLLCTICPATLPPTSGEVSEVMTLAYTIVDMMQSYANSLSIAVSSLTTGS